ncbi:hypothetical protein SDC9_116095 [bioreactor metagenome]|uniref:Uncharacterized protein n=1 Tax=bioreactor metagenome TaxID=1076179 RepID=A0A645BWX4_9ZZZZ
MVATSSGRTCFDRPSTELGCIFKNSLPSFINSFNDNSLSEYSSCSSKTMIFLMPSSPSAIALIFFNCPPDTIIILASECTRRKIRSLLSSSFIDKGTLIAPACKIASSPIIQAFLPSESKAILSPGLTPSFRRPAVKTCTCCLVSR